MSDWGPEQGSRACRMAASTGCSLVRSKDKPDADQVPSVVGRVLADSKLPSVRMMPVFEENPARQIVPDRDVEVPVRAVEIVDLVDPDWADSASHLPLGPNLVSAEAEMN